MTIISTWFFILLCVVGAFIFSRILVYDGNTMKIMASTDGNKMPEIEDTLDEQKYPLKYAEYSRKIEQVEHDSKFSNSKKYDDNILPVYIYTGEPFNWIEKCSTPPSQLKLYESYGALDSLFPTYAWFQVLNFPQIYRFF